MPRPAPGEVWQVTPRDSEQKITLPARRAYRPEAKKTKFLSDDPYDLGFFPSRRLYRAGGLSLLLFKKSAPSVVFAVLEIKLGALTSDEFQKLGKRLAALLKLDL